MTAALVDNGSLEPAAHRNLRTLAAALSARTGVSIHAVSLKHSDRIPTAALDGVPASTLPAFVRAEFARGERVFLFVPFFISAQGAVGSNLGRELECLRAQFGHFDFTFTDGLAARGAIAAIAADRIRCVIAARALRTPPVIVVDHGGPSPASATLRDAVAADLRLLLGAAIGPLAAASMEGVEHIHNRPLLADALRHADFNRSDIVVAPLFLAPGRHAGPTGDIARLCRAAERSTPGLRCHTADLVGTHPLVVETLTEAVREALLTRSERTGR